MKIVKIENGFLKENAYLIGDEECYIIDPGQFAYLILNAVEKNFKKVKGILLTHGHWDHCGCVDELVRNYKCPVYLHPYDIEQIDGTFVGNPSLGKMIVTLETKTTDCFKINDPNLIIYETPGHTSGSVCYYFKNENVLFSGDTLFLLSVGRTDLPGGGKKDQMKTLKLIKSLNASITVLPGHGEKTNIGYELDNNPYLIGI